MRSSKEKTLDRKEIARKKDIKYYMSVNKTDIKTQKVNEYAKYKPYQIHKIDKGE